MTIEKGYPPITNETYIEAAEAMDFPRVGLFAEKLWKLCSSGRLPYQEAAQLYRDCGYIPFCGYPLSRAGKIPHMTREQVQRAWDTNPLCRLLNREA